MEKDERRLQSLARILQGPSECVAIVFVNNTLFIAANELTKTSRDNNAYIRSINEVILYLKKIFNDKKITEDKRQLVFTKVCEDKLKTLKGRIDAPKECIKSVINHVMQKSEKLSGRKLVIEYQAAAGAAGYLFGIFSRLYSDFCKVENAVKRELSKILKADYLILKTSKKSGTHAEVQLLEYILPPLLLSASSDEIKGPKQTIRLGISKLSCLHCAAMIETANQILESNEITIEFEFPGKHNIDFQWRSPELFQEGFDSYITLLKENEAISNAEDSEEIKEPLDSSIPFQIGFYTAKQAMRLLDQQKPQHISMTPDISSSDPEITVEEQIQILKTQLEEKLWLLNSLSNTTIKTIEENIKAIELVFKLYEINGFIGLLLLDPTGITTSILTETFDNIIDELNPADPQKTIEESLLVCLKIEAFVGVKIAGFFKDFIPNALSDSSKQKRKFSPDTKEMVQEEFPSLEYSDSTSPNQTSLADSVRLFKRSKPSSREPKELDDDKDSQPERKKNHFEN